MNETTLYLGDCLEILPTLEAHSIDAILTDLPYGTTACSWDEIIPFEPMWKQVKRVLKERGVFVTTASQPFTSKLIMSNLDWFRYEWIWEKSSSTGFLDANRRPLKAHENILVFARGLTTYNPQKIKGLPIHSRGAGRKKEKHATYNGVVKRTAADLSGMHYPRSVIKFSKHPETQDKHTNQKPAALYRYLTLTYTNPGDTILDFTMGSGTTGVAAIHLGRSFVGIEIDPDYFAIAEQRIKEAQRQMVLPLFGSQP